jgi:hypothetical protein
VGGNGGKVVNVGGEGLVAESGRNQWHESETHRCLQCNAKYHGKWY